MKKLRSFTAMLLLASVFVGFNACSDDDKEEEKPTETYEKLIIGTWKLIVDTDEIEHIVFKTDGTMTWGSDDSVSDYARYTIKGNTLYLLWSDADVIDNESDEWWKNNNLKDWEDVPLHELNSKIMKLEWSDIETYERIK